MRIDTSVPLNNWKAIGPAAQAAEALGYDGIVTYEIQNDPFLSLAFAAMATERISLGTGIVVAFPRSPMVVAEIGYDLHRQSHGRFHLGLGAQVKGHNERRFSVPWSPPAPRMREYVESLRAIWRCWEKNEPLHYEGKHYRFTLMTPEFSPPPTGLPRIPISIAAVGPASASVHESIYQCRTRGRPDPESRRSKSIRATPPRRSPRAGAVRTPLRRASPLPGPR